MTANEFETNAEVQAVISAIAGARKVAHLQAGLEKAARLEPEARKYIADILEEKLVASFKKTSEQHLRQVRDIASRIQDAREAGDSAALDNLVGEGVRELEPIGPIVAFIDANKGDAACVLVKSYSEAAAKFSDAEYKLPENYLRIICIAVEKEKGFVPPASKPGSFHAKTPGF